MPIIDVITETIIFQPIEKVADYAANPDNASESHVNIKSAEWKTSKPLIPGTHVAFKVQFMGREMAYIYEVTEYTPHKKMMMRTSEGPFSMETTYQWESVGPNQTK